jgi:hypothetical protein
MHRRAALGSLASLAAGFAESIAAGPRQASGSWMPLFNGRDLAGWDTFLGRPHRLSVVPGVSRGEQGEYTSPVGLNRDPNRVFSVVDADGGPVIRISGETYGALTTSGEFENYHLRFDFKWGAKKWPPRQDAVRDSGCLYHGVGPHGASYGFWMQSVEFQIQEGDCGDFYGLAGVIADAEAVRRQPADPKDDPVYTRGARTIAGTTRRIVKDRDHERPFGRWNTLELHCLGDRSVHVVNGAANMRLTGLRRRVDGREVPLTRGRIQLQSEGAEVFFRNIAIRQIRELPAASA